jgi:hypothetical protein
MSASSSSPESPRARKLQKDRAVGKAGKSKASAKGVAKKSSATNGKKAKAKQSILNQLVLPVKMKFQQSQGGPVVTNQLTNHVVLAMRRHLLVAESVAMMPQQPVAQAEVMMLLQERDVLGLMKLQLLVLQDLRKTAKQNVSHVLSELSTIR